MKKRINNIIINKKYENNANIHRCRCNLGNFNNAIRGFLVRGFIDVTI
jgi:hypothetical protein